MQAWAAYQPGVATATVAAEDTAQQEASERATAQLDRRLQEEDRLRSQMAAAADAGATSTVTVELTRDGEEVRAEVAPVEGLEFGPNWDAQEDRRAEEERAGGTPDDAAEQAPEGSRAADSGGPAKAASSGAPPAGFVRGAPLAGFVAASTTSTADDPEPASSFRPLCANFARGACTRGNDCPYAHSMAAAAFLGTEAVEEERIMPERREEFSPVASSSSSSSTEPDFEAAD